jgi:hypothetical protein
VTNGALPVANGSFMAQMDFGSGIFTGPDRWLQIAVRTNGALTFTNLSPRQKLTPTPYTIFANTASNLSGQLPAAQLSGTLPLSAFTGYTNTVALTNGGNLFAGAFKGNGANVTNIGVTHLTGILTDAQLPVNTAFVNSNQTFSGANTFSGSNSFTSVSAFSGAATFNGGNVFNGANNFTNLYGNIFWGTFHGNGLVGWVVPGGVAPQAKVDTGYVLTSAQLTTVTLPSVAVAGDVVRIAGGGAGGWRVAQNAGQFILGNFTSYANSYWLPSDAPSLAYGAITASADGSKMAAAVYDNTHGIYVSPNYGQNWTISTAPNAFWRSIASSSTGSQLIAGQVGLGSIYYSSNYGSSWTVALGAPGADWFGMAMSANGSNAVAAANNGGIYTSTNSGRNFQLRSAGLPASAPWWCVASSASGSTLVAGAYPGAIYTSADAGNNWTLQAGAPSANWSGLACSADGTKMVGVVYGGGIYTSVNSGVTWVLQAGAPTVANWESVACSDDGAKIVVAVYGGAIRVSSDFGVTWPVQPGTTGKNWVAVCMSADGRRIAAALNTGTIYYSTATMQTSTTAGTGGFISGPQGSAVELLYIGNNQWMPVSSSGSIWAN